MASLELTRSGTYAVRWRDSNGKNHSKSLKTKNRRVAKAALKRFEAEHEGRMFGPKVTRYTIDDLCVLYLAHAEKYYCLDGMITSEVAIIRTSLMGLTCASQIIDRVKFAPISLLK